MNSTSVDRVGVVAIGRNEGERLQRCVASVMGRVKAVVYVDSGSTDGSVAMAKAAGANVVELDLSTPFTAARARNGGFDRLISSCPEIEFVQFIDGDCEVVPTWFDLALATFAMDAKVGVVCGRRRERFPEKSIYNALCDIEWNTPIGPALACGGDAMMRVAAFRAANGFDPSVIAGEEPELCVRLRAAGSTIQRIDAEMTLHDAAMTRLSQWWKRNVRGGHAYAEGKAMHGAPPERHWVKENRSNYLWGLAFPILCLALAWPTRGISVAVGLLGYLVLFARVLRGAKRRGLSRDIAQKYAFFIVLSKFPQAIGQLKYRVNRLTGQRSRIIEYKGADLVATSPREVHSH